MHIIQNMATATIFSIPVWRYVLYGTFILLLTLLLYAHSAEILKTIHIVSPDTVSARIATMGSFAYVLFVVLIIAGVISPLPSSSLWLVGGYVFSPGLALVLICIAEVIGGSINYIVGRYAITKLITPSRFPRTHEVIHRYKHYITAGTVFLLGLSPAGTANITGYTAGFIRMPYITYISAWTLGVMTLATLTVLLGNGVRERNFIVVLILLAVIAALFVFSKRFTRLLSKQLRT